jgi:hypothetical protein
MKKTNKEWLRATKPLKKKKKKKMSSSFGGPVGPSAVR